MQSREGNAPQAGSLAAALGISAAAKASFVQFGDQWQEQRFSLFSSNDFGLSGETLRVGSDGTVSLLWTKLPAETQLARTAAWSWQVKRTVPATDLISRGLVSPDETALRGALVVRGDGPESPALLAYRGRSDEPVRWAGAPKSDPVWTAEGARLNPRRPFEAYTHQRQHRSRPWYPADLDLAASLLELVVDAGASETLARAYVPRFEALGIDAASSWAESQAR